MANVVHILGQAEPIFQTTVELVTLLTAPVQTRLIDYSTPSEPRGILTLL